MSTKVKKELSFWDIPKELVYAGRVNGVDQYLQRPKEEKRKDTLPGVDQRKKPEARKGGR